MTGKTVSQLQESLNIEFSLFQEKLRKREPDTVFCALLVVLLLLFAGILGALHLSYAPTEFSAGPLGNQRQESEQQNQSAGEPAENDSSPLTTENFNSRATKLTFATDSFEETRSFSFPSQAELEQATLTITPTRMMDDREALDGTNSFVTYCDLNSDGSPDQLSVSHSRGLLDYPDMKIKDGSTGKYLYLNMGELATRLREDNLSQAITLSTGQELSFSPTLSSMDQRLRELATGLDVSHFYPLVVLADDFSGDGYTDLVLFLSGMYGTIFLENTGGRDFFESGTAFLEMNAFQAIFDDEFFKGSTVSVYQPYINDVDGDSSPELFIWFSLVNEVGANIVVSGERLIHHDSRYLNGEPFQSSTSGVNVGSGMVVFHHIPGSGTTSSVECLPIFYSSRHFIHPQITKLPQSYQEKEELGAAAFQEFFFRENTSTPPFTQEQLENLGEERSKDESGSERLALRELEPDTAFYLNFDVLLFMDPEWSLAANGTLEAEEILNRTKVTSSGISLHYEYKKNLSSVSHSSWFRLMELDHTKSEIRFQDQRHFPFYYGREIPGPYLLSEWDSEGMNLLVRASASGSRFREYELTGTVPLQTTTYQNMHASESFGTPNLAYPLWEQVLTGDVNGDGVKDMVVLTPGEGVSLVAHIFLYEPGESGQGSFKSSQKLQFDRESLIPYFDLDLETYIFSQLNYNMVLADLTGSGTVELIFSIGNNLLVFTNTRQIQHHFAGEESLDPEEEILFPREGMLEFIRQYAVSKREEYSPPFFQVNNQGNQLVERYQRQNQSHFPLGSISMVGDIDSDGDLDLFGFTIIETYSTTIQLQSFTYMNQGQGEIKKQDFYRLRNYDPELGIVVKSMSYDFYQDGVEELLVLSDQDGKAGSDDYFEFTIFTRRSQGLFLGEKLKFDSSIKIHDFFLSDVNGDGLTDLVFLDNSAMKFKVYLNNRKWNFNKMPAHEVPISGNTGVSDYIKQAKNPRYLGFHDLDYDGARELVFVEQFEETYPTIIPPSYNVSIFRISEDGSLAWHEYAFRDDFFSDSYPFYPFVSIQDMDGQGMDEIVLSFPERVVILEISQDWEIIPAQDMDLPNLIRFTTSDLDSTDLKDEPLFFDANDDGQTDMLLLLEWKGIKAPYLLMNNPASAVPLLFPLTNRNLQGQVMAIKLVDVDFDGKKDLILLTMESLHIMLKEDFQLTGSEGVLAELEELIAAFLAMEIGSAEFYELLGLIQDDMPSPFSLLASYPHELDLHTTTLPRLACFTNISSENIFTLKQKTQALAHTNTSYYKENFLSFLDLQVLVGSNIRTLTSQIHGYPQTLNFYLAKLEEAGINEPIYAIDGVFFQQHQVDITAPLKNYLRSQGELHGMVEVPLTFILGDRLTVHGTSRSIFDVSLELHYRLPELEVTDLRVKGRLVEGETVEIEARVRNTGDISAEYFKVKLFVDGELEEWTRMDRLEPGEEKTIHFSWKTKLFSDSGEHNLVVAVNDQEELVEANQYNNLAQTRIVVKQDRVFTGALYMTVFLVMLGFSFYLYRDSRDWLIKRNYAASGKQVGESRSTLVFMKQEGLPVHPLRDIYRGARTSLQKLRFQESQENTEEIQRVAYELLEGSMPEFSVAHPETLYCGLEEWCSVPLKITNKGDITAQQVALRVLGNVKVMDNILPFKLEAGESREVVFGAFPHRYGSFEFRVKIRFIKRHDDEKRRFTSETRFAIRCERP